MTTRLDPNTLLLAAVVAQLQPIAEYFATGSTVQRDAIRSIPHRLQLLLDEAGESAVAELVEKLTGRAL